MPGSPPISTTWPSTMPPPSTRSSSPWPVGVRATSTASISASGRTPAEGASAAKAPPSRFLPPAAAVGSATVSSSEFQAPQPGHLPSQRGLVAPQALQV